MSSVNSSSLASGLCVVCGCNYWCWSVTHEYLCDFVYHFHSAVCCSLCTLCD